MQVKFRVPANTEITAGEIFVPNTLDPELGYGNWDVFEPDLVATVDDIPAIILNNGFETLKDGRRPKGDPDYTHYIYRENEVITAHLLLPEVKFEISPDNFSNFAEFETAVSNGIVNTYLYPEIDTSSLKWTANFNDVNTKVYLVIESLKWFRLGGEFGADFAQTVVARVKMVGAGEAGISAINADVVEGLQVGNDNVAAGATVLTMQAVGGTPPYTYELVDNGELSADNSLFTIGSAEIKVGENALTEAKIYKVYVKASDTEGNTYEEGFDIPVAAAPDPGSTLSGAKVNFLSTNNAKSFQKASVTQFNTATEDESTTVNTISTDNSEVPMYGWTDSNNDGYWYADTNETYLPEDSSSLFELCTSLESVDLSKFDTSKVTDMGSMFYSDSELTEVNLDNVDTSNVTDMSEMFFGCSKLETVDVSSFDTSKVTNMSGMFEGCSDLKTIYANNSFVTTNVTESTGMFNGCTAITGGNGTTYNDDSGSSAHIDTTDSPGYFTKATTATLGTGTLAIEFFLNGKSATSFAKATTEQYNTAKADSSITMKTISTSDSETPVYLWVNSDKAAYWYSEANKVYMYKETKSMFSYLSTLVTIDLSGLDSSNVTNMSGMFQSCSSLATIVGLDRLNTSNVTDMTNMFKSCKGLISLDLSSFDTSNVTNMDDMFNGCTSLTTIIGLDKFNTSKVTEMRRMFYSCESLVGLDLSNFDMSNVIYIDSMFNMCSVLTEIKGIDDWNTSNVTAMNYIFGNCFKMGDLDLSKWDVSNIRSAISAFGSCHSTSLNLSGWKFKNATSISQMFIACTELTDLNVSNWDLGNIDNLNGMFQSCGALTSLDLSTWDTSKVDSFYGMFKDCTKLTEVKGFENWNTSKVADMSNMFQNCSSFITLDLSSFNTPNLINMKDMFNGCSSLTNVNLSSFDTSNVTTMRDMFENCTSLTTLDLSSFDTSSLTDTGYMFDGCTALKTIYVSDSFVTTNKSGYNMFNNCTALIGGNGTVYSSDNTNITYARVDTSDTPGYFTARNTILSNNSNNKLSNTDIKYAVSFARASLEQYNEAKADTSITINTISTSDSYYPIYGWRDSDKAGYWYSEANKISLPADSSGMFSSFTEMETIDFTGIKSFTMTSMSNMFNSCRSLTNIENLDSLNTSNVTTMRDMFNGCTELTSLDLSSWDTSKVTDMSYMFQICLDLTTLDLSSFDTSSVTNMGYMFDSCGSLKAIYASDSFVTTKVTESTNMFEGCDNLVGGNGTSYSSSSVDKTYACIDTTGKSGYFTEMAGTLETGKNVNTILKGLNTSSVSDFTKATAEQYNKAKNSSSVEIKTISTENSAAPVYCWAEGDMARYWYSKASKVYMNADSSYMFNEFAQMGSLDLSDFNTSKVTDMSYMFAYCSALSLLKLSNFDTSNVTNMSNMFRDCSLLDELVLISFNTSKVTDMDCMFMNSGVVSIYVDGDTFVTTALTKTDNQMFEGCGSIDNGTGQKYDSSKTGASMATTNSSGYLRDKSTYIGGVIY